VAQRCASEAQEIEGSGENSGGLPQRASDAFILKRMLPLTLRTHCSQERRCLCAGWAKGVNRRSSPIGACLPSWFVCH